MIKSIRICSVVLVFCSFAYFFSHFLFEVRDKEVQNKIIDSVFGIDISNDVGEVRDDPSDEDSDDSNVVSDDYLGFIYIPRFDVKRLIKYGTDSDVLDSLYVGVYYKSGFLDSNDLIILAGHNVRNVFSSLHKLDIGDCIFIGGSNFYRKFIVYDKLVVDEYNNDYFYNRSSELLLITCDKKGYRLLVFLKEDL